MHYSTIVAFLTAFTCFVSSLPTGFEPIEANPVKVGIRDQDIVPRAPLGGGSSDVGQRAKILKPIKSEQLSKRSRDNGFSKLDLGPKVEMLYGAPQADGSVFLANMTFYAPKGQPLIMMEDLESVTSSIDCDRGRDGREKISLTFKNKTVVNYALGKWSWVNQKKESQFIMITNVTLHGKPEKWSTVGSSFEVDFGRALLPKNIIIRSETRKRDFFDDIENRLAQAGDVIRNGAEKVGEFVSNIGEPIRSGDLGGVSFNAITGGGDFDADVSISLDTGDAGKDRELFSDPTGTVKVKCVDCNVRGSILLSGRVVVNDFRPSTITFTAQPVDLSAKAELDVVVTAAFDQFLVNPLRFSQNIVSIPLGGIVIPGVFSIGPKLDFEIGAELTAAAKSKFRFGLEASLPNTVRLIGNILDAKASQATGFEGTEAKLIPFSVDAVETSITATAFSSPVISLGFDILNGAFGAEASIKFNTPSLGAELIAEFREEGVCAQDPGASKTGLRVASSAVVDCSLFVGTDQTVGEITIVEQSLFSIPFEFVDVCLPVNIPVLN